ncbi:MAG: alkane 1-monooxygenase [Myxococcales bacterium]|nr:alkane 1-monooxygenase [Myxococcales bacterium]
MSEARAHRPEPAPPDPSVSPAAGGPRPAPEVEPRGPGHLEVLRIWAPHTAALFLPVVALGFLVTAPHSGWAAFLTLVLAGLAMQVADRKSGRQRHAPRPDLPSWPFDALLFVLVAIQFANILLLARFFTLVPFFRTDTLMAILIVGASSGYSGIVVAHELIHRRSKAMQWLGRTLLCTVMYEHFYTEHLRGHHVRVGTPEDPATARFGETFTQFYVRTVPAQFRSAWRIEAKRLGEVDMPFFDRRQLRNRVLHGVVAEWTLALAMLWAIGLAAFVGFLLQAVFASRALEVVNYFEHWGLTRTSQRVQPVDSWDTHSRFTYYALTGLTRHADHHAHATRPYQQLRVCEEAPVLPRGYIALFPLVLARNAKFRELMTAELERKQLGPFAPDVRPPTQTAAAEGAA